MTAERIREERERLDWSQETVASICGCTRRTVIAWEAGESSPKAEQLSALADKGVDVYYVLTGQRVATATTLTAREAALVDNYRASDEDAKKALEKTSAALAQSAEVIKKAG